MNSVTSHARARTLLVVTCIILEAIVAAELPAQPGGLWDRRQVVSP